MQTAAPASGSRIRSAVLRCRTFQIEDHPADPLLDFGNDFDHRIERLEDLLDMLFVKDIEGRVFEKLKISSSRKTLSAEQRS